MNTLTAFIVEEDGVTSIEYGLIAALIVLAIVTAVGTLGATVKLMYDTIAGAVSTALQ